MKINEENIIKEGIRSLREFGYPYVNENNIITDKIYSNLFKSFLNELTYDYENVNEEVVRIANKLINKIENKMN